MSGHAVWRRNRHWTFEVAVPLYCWMIWIWMNNDISLTDTYDYIMQQWNNMIPNIPSYPFIDSYVQSSLVFTYGLPLSPTPNTHLTGRHTSLQWLTGHTTALDLSNQRWSGGRLEGCTRCLPTISGENPMISFSKVMVFWCILFFSAQFAAKPSIF